jgi:hypothetical protein
MKGKALLFRFVLCSNAALSQQKGAFPAGFLYTNSHFRTRAPRLPHYVKLMAGSRKAAQSWIRALDFSAEYREKLNTEQSK